MCVLSMKGLALMVLMVTVLTLMQFLVSLVKKDNLYSAIIVTFSLVLFLIADGLWRWAYNGSKSSFLFAFFVVVFFLLKQFKKL